MGCLLTSQFARARLFNFKRNISLPLPCVTGGLLCPVTALRNHLRINQFPSEAPLYSVCSNGNVHPVTYAHFCSFLAKVLKSVGLDCTNYSLHSFRRGGATFAFESNVPSELIKVQGNWCSDCYMYLIYLEMSDSQKCVAAARMAAAMLSSNDKSTSIHNITIC